MGNEADEDPVRHLAAGVGGIDHARMFVFGRHHGLRFSIRGLRLLLPMVLAALLVPSALLAATGVSPTRIPAGHAGAPHRTAATQPAGNPAGQSAGTSGDAPGDTARTACNPACATTLDTPVNTACCQAGSAACLRAAPDHAAIHATGEAFLGPVHSSWANQRSIACAKRFAAPGSVRRYIEGSISSCSISA